MKTKLIILAAVVATSFVACVPKKKFTELSDKKNKADQEIETPQRRVSNSCLKIQPSTEKQIAHYATK
jgi:hypothetical protein